MVMGTIVTIARRFMVMRSRHSDKTDQTHEELLGAFIESIYSMRRKSSYYYNLVARNVAVRFLLAVTT